MVHAMSAFSVVVVFAAVAGVLPLRSGHGQHAHAGPGAVTVWHLYDNTTKPRHDEQRTDALDYFRAPEPGSEAVPEYVGRHRLNERYEMYLPPLFKDVRLTPNFPRCGLGRS